MDIGNALIAETDTVVTMAIAVSGFMVWAELLFEQHSVSESGLQHHNSSPASVPQKLMST